MPNVVLQVLIRPIDNYCRSIVSGLLPSYALCPGLVVPSVWPRTEHS